MWVFVVSVGHSAEGARVIRTGDNKRNSDNRSLWWPGQPDGQFDDSGQGVTVLEEVGSWGFPRATSQESQQKAHVGNFSDTRVHPRFQSAAFSMVLGHRKAAGLALSANCSWHICGNRCTIQKVLSSSWRSRILQVNVNKPKVSFLPTPGSCSGRF